MLDGLNREYTKRFRGPRYDMILHDMKEDTWALVPTDGTMANVIAVGRRDQILQLYDDYNGYGDCT